MLRNSSVSALRIASATVCSSAFVACICDIIIIASPGDALELLVSSRA